MVLSWSVASELNNLGFYLQRSTSSSGQFDRISELISGRGTANSPADYSWTDVGPSGTVLYYMLEDIDFSGRSNLNGPVRVILGGSSSWGELKAEFTE